MKSIKINLEVKNIDRAIEILQEIKELVQELNELDIEVQASIEKE